MNVCQCKLEETIDVDATISEVSRTRTFKTLILISPVVFPQGKILAKIWLKILRRLDKQVGENFRRAPLMQFSVLSVSVTELHQPRCHLPFV